MTNDQKAAMWDALMSCQRVRVLGHAKLGDPQMQHMGIEFWGHARFEVSDAPDREAFLKFVQAMIPVTGETDDHENVTDS